MKDKNEKLHIKISSSGLEVDVNDILKKVGVFSDVAQEEGVLNLVQKNDLLEFKQDEYVIKEGERGACAYIALSGELEVSRKSLSGDDIVVATFNVDFDKVYKDKLLFPLLGESGLVSTEPRTATIKTKSNAVLLKLDYTDFAKVAEDFPKIGMHVFREICYMLQARLRTSNNNVVALFQAYLATMHEDLMDEE